MVSVISQLLILFTFIIIGYTLKKTKVVTFETSSMLSKLEVFLFCPAVNFSSFANNLNIVNIKEKSVYLIISICVIVITIFGAKLLARVFTKDIYERGVFSYNFTTGNYGYMGYPLVQAIYGDDMLLNFIIFSIPVAFYIYTEGYRVLTAEDKLTLKSIVKSPFLYSISAGLIVGLSGIQLPGWINGVLDGASDCMAPIAMIITGIVLAEYNILPLLKKYKAYIASAIRLLIIPIILMLILKSLGINKEVITIATFFYSVPAGLNPVIFPNSIGKDCKTGLSMVLISNILCIITIPLIVTLI